MNFSISDQMVSQFLSGLAVVLALVAVGGVVAILLRGMAARYPFARMAIALALAPLSMGRFLDSGGVASIQLYAMIVMLLGITIDGINHLLTPKEAAKPEPQALANTASPAPGKAKPGMVVWEKAE